MDSVAHLESHQEITDEKLETALLPEEVRTTSQLYRSAIFVSMPVFMGYSGLVVLQAHIKDRLEIPDGGNTDSFVFGIATSFLYLGNLIFRLMHNVIFVWIKPRQRVFMAFACMALSQLVLAVMYYIVDSHSLVWVFVAYIIGGVAIGSFESNLMSCLTPLGHGTKYWAVIGLPVGFNVISIGGFFLFALFPNSASVEMGVYLFIGVANIAGLLFYAIFIPNLEYEASVNKIAIFVKDMKHWRQWFPMTWRHCLALAFDMCAVSIFAAVALYIFDRPEIPLWPRSTTTVPKNAFQSVYFLFSFLGDFLSRKVAYKDKTRNPLWFLVLSAIGATLVLLKTALVAPFGMFLVMFANGSIYAQTTKFVDNQIPDQYNLITLSIWLFLGDIGSFSGSQGVQAIRAAVGAVEVAPTTKVMTTLTQSLALTLSRTLL